jgi:dTDP-3-amino-3,4,6-trideoxy-alpha-D-glucose transaminase
MTATAPVAVPFLELGAATAELRPEIDAAVARVLSSGRYLLGPELEAFEAEWAAYAGARHCVALGSGLDALTLGLRASGIGPGDEVLVPGQTFVATWLAVTAVGAEPVPVDVDPVHHALDPRAAAAAVTPRTAAILPVDLYGHPADHVELRALADRHGLLLLDDAAQAHGARLHGRPVGTYADAAAWSFYPGKNLGALGDGGAVTTDDAELAARLRRLRNYGSERRYEHVEAGQNSRLDELQAAMLRVKLTHLPAWNARRRRLAERYVEGLRDVPVALPAVRRGAEPSWHLFTVRSPERDRLREHLESVGIGTLVHYPVPPHRQPAYAGSLAASTALPVADAVAATVLSLPIGPHLDDDDADLVVAELRSWATDGP